MYYTVCEVAKRLGLSPHTIRFYAKEGLLDFVERDSNGNRIFKEADFEKMFIIASLKRAGMTIKQIKKFTSLCDGGDATISERLKIINGQRENVEEKITGLHDALDVLKYKSWLYEKALQAGTMENINLEEMPPNIRRVKERIRLLTNDMETRYKNAGA